MIEVDYAPGTTLGARGAELAVLADIGSGDPLAQELVTLLNQPGTGIRQVLELLAPGGVPRVQDFAVAEAIGPSRTRVVLRGWAGVRAGELRLEARGTWRGSTVNGPEVELYDASGVPQARHHRLQTGVVRASVLRIRLEAAGPSRGAAGGTGAANGPRRALPPPQPNDEPAGDGSAGGVLRLDSGDGLGLDQDYVLGGEPAIPADWNHHHSDPVLVHLSGERISGRHATINVDRSTVRVTDLGSEHGTEVLCGGSDEIVRLAPHEPFEIGPGDVVRLGGERTVAFDAPAPTDR